MQRLSARGLRGLLLFSGFFLIFVLNSRQACAADPYAFNGSRAFADLQHLVSFGPRPPGSKALEASRAWIISQLKQAGCRGVEDRFLAATPMGNIPMVNVIAEIPGKEPDRIIMIAGHYDTKLENSFRFVGANDGGSSAAFLLEMARELRQTPHKLTYWIVFFDGEEALRQEWEGNDNTYGSRHLVQKADRLGYSKYFLKDQTAVTDDHIPFVNAGVSAVDLIDFNYGPNNSYWHTAQDTVEHCSPASLTIVGRVVKATLSELEKSPRVE